MKLIYDFAKTARGYSNMIEKRLKTMAGDNSI